MDLEDAQTTIAIAEGILAERHRIPPAEAAQLLAGLARTDDLSLLEAADLVILMRRPLT
ncbi:ANTAR domain-containing protein [Kribbella endophytica]